MRSVWKARSAEVLLPGETDPRSAAASPWASARKGRTASTFQTTRRTPALPGWLCSGREEEWCARPCRLGDSQGCPEGFFCADTVPQPACLPTCETRGCPAGQQCIPFSEGVSVCAQVYGPQCQQTPCPDGRECDVTHDPPHPGKVWMECVEECGEGLPPCARWEGLRRLALPARLRSAGAPDHVPRGYHCSRRWSEPYSCQPLFG